MSAINIPVCHFCGLDGDFWLGFEAVPISSSGDGNGQLEVMSVAYVSKALLSLGT